MKVHYENEICPHIIKELKNNPTLLSEAAEFANVAAQYRLVTSQDLGNVANQINKIIGTNLSFEGTYQFSRDIQVFKRLNEDAFSKSGVFFDPQRALEYLKSASKGQVDYLEKRLTGTAQEVDWLR